MSEKCSIATCERLKHALCHGCKLNFCREHMFEHSLATHLQLNPLIDQTNQLQDVLKGLNHTMAIEPAFKQLELWRQKAHQTVDLYYGAKLQELELYVINKIKEQEQELIAIQARITTSSREQDTTHELIDILTLRIESLRRDINKVLQSDFPLQINPLTIDKNVINIEPLFDISKLPPVYRILNRHHQSFTSIAANDKLLLLHHKGTLLFVDESLSTFKQIQWTYGPIYDMCYSIVLQQFIVINEHEVFLLNKDNMSITKVSSIPYQQWFACTCSNTSLYLSTQVYSSSIMEFNLLDSMAFVKKWTSPDTCVKDEAIDGIFYNNDKLALMISSDAQKSVRIELRVASSLKVVWSLRLDLIYDENQAYRFCLINNDEWLVSDHTGSRLLHISNDGKIKSIVAYQPAPCCAVKFTPNMLAVSTKSVIQLHKFL
ncbi:unnamed protein product [Adineta steineri]|uniref:B box-type domain-containing protein n=1 Tax=Adineta steineri TaxID=433720 RepID=A0A818RJ10_9BILA|nr:unnamed protein product [Adineta steineri]CAF3658461.1 unnamed protein product [Adineta steineri]CAF3728425.1 unnamed protein product [Adineta steineri]